MKILFLISLNTHGRGGHLYSLYHIADEIASKHQVGIVSIGPGDNTTIAKHPNYISHINFNGIDLLRLKRESGEIIDKLNPEVVHCFDLGSYNLIRLLYPGNKFKLALNKCGGFNPRFAKFPYVKNLVLFSAENKEWFESNIRYNDSNISLIPNRVARITTIPLNIVKPQGFFSFVKIARIGVTYKKSILDAIALIDTLFEYNNKLKLKLFIIGVVESPNVLSEISNNKHVKDGTVIILTDDEYTRDASKMLYLADAAIATGRGVMEAASLGLPILTINSMSNIPVLITKELFWDAFKTNFSGRNVFPSLIESENISHIEKMITEEGFYEELSNYMNSKFIELFDVKKAKFEYEKFYNSIKNNGNPKSISSFIFALKSSYNFFRNSRS